MKAKYQVIEVEWEDSASDHGWMSANELAANVAPAICRTVGYLAHMDRKVVVVVQNRQDSWVTQGEVFRVGEAFTIPQAVIQKIRVLR